MRYSYRTKLLLVLIALVATLQLGTYIAARASIRSAVIRYAERDLSVGAEIFGKLMQTRGQQLSSSVSVLVDDFGFRQAIASSDSSTIRSALINQADRVGADRAMVIDSAHKVLADSDPGAADADYFPKLLAQADENGAATELLILDDIPYQFVVTIVRAPLRIGWAGMGFELDAPLAEEMKKLTGLDVSFVDVLPTAPRYFAGTLSDRDAELLLPALEQDLTAKPHIVELNGEPLLTLMRPLNSDRIRLAVVLQVPMEKVLQPYHTLSRQLLWVTLLGLAGAVVAGIFLARSLSRSMQSLATAAQRISDGDYTSRVQVAGRDEFGNLARAFNVMQDAIAERENRVLHQSQHDSLTGLPNRTVALRSLASAMTSAGPGDHVAAVIFDIRNFKAINEAFGHDVGDRVLQAVAERTRAAVKERDVVVRLGNDEFLLVLAELDLQHLPVIAQRIQQALAQPLSIGGVAFNIEAHLGIATYPTDGNTPEILVRRADIAMNMCKQQNVQYAMTYQGGWEESRMRRLALLQNLKDAIEGSGLHLNFQPKLRFAEPGYLGAEALIRWQHPRLGFIGPDEFIPIAEHSGNIVLLTQWVIENAVAQIAAWRREGMEVVVSVNVSALDLLEADLPAYVDVTLREHGVGPEMLCIELTESSAMHDTQRSMATLQKLQAMGVRLSVDDFGTGYSSLAQLKKLNVHELKIDKSFVLKLDQNEDDLVIVRSTIELGHNLGLEVVAEGVENAASRQILQKLGCDMIQGYLLAKPLPADQFLEWARRHRAALARTSAASIDMDT